MVPVLSRRIHEGMELPEKEAFGEIIPGKGEVLMNYEKFLESKMQSAPMSGMEPGKLNEKLFPYWMR